MKRWRRGNTSIRKRFTMASVLLMTGMILVSYLFSAWYMVSATEKKLLEDYQDVLEFTSRQITRYHNELVRYAAILTSDEELQKIFAEQEQMSEAEKIKASTQISRILRNYELLRDDCICAEVLLLSGDVYTSDSSNRNTFHSASTVSWMDELDWNVNQDFYLSHEFRISNIQYDEIVTYYCNVGNYLTNQEKSGKLLLHIKPDAFESLLYETDMEYSWCAILNSKNEILAETGEIQEGNENYQELIEQIENQNGIYEDENGWFLCNSRLKSGLSLILFMPKDRLHNEEMNILWFFFALFVICLCLFSGFMFVVSNRLSKPIVTLSNAARQISEGRLDVNLESDQKDEIGTLTESFNQMAVSLERQMQDLKKAERVRSNLQMSILMAQINPHFIYNTLNSAVFLSRVGEGRKAERLLQLFIQMLQNNMRSGIDGMLTTIGEDIQDLNSYAELQAIRYPGRFSFTITADEEVYPHSIPRLMLQPLVENALNHGVLSREYGTIQVHIFEENQYLVFEIKDDGEGMDEQKIKDILSEKEMDGRSKASRIHSISIENIKQRLNLIYKEDYTFEIQSRVEEGTTIYIRLPMEYKEATTRKKGEEMV